MSLLWSINNFISQILIFKLNPSHKHKIITVLFYVFKNYLTVIEIKKTLRYFEMRLFLEMLSNVVFIYLSFLEQRIKWY